MDIERVDLSLICRTCKCVSSSMRSLFSGMENANISPHNPRIDEMLMACAAVQVSYGDGLPTLMCEMCCQSLKGAFQFKKQCETVDASLREYCKTMKVNAIKQELQNSEFMESLNTLSSLLNSNEAQSVKDTSKDSTNVITIDPSTSVDVEINEKPKLHPETDYIQFLDNNQMLLTCRECAKMFTTLEGLRCHKRMHAGNTFKCKQCDKEYTRKNHLERHEASHGKRKVHVCKVCNKTLTRMEHLKRHLITHLREKPFNCKTCNRGFNRVEHLHNHIPRCKGENVHICPVCNKAFNREDSLEVHKQQHDSAQLSLPTIENLDNIEEHYFQVDYDANITFSDNSDLEDCFEPQVEVTESGADSKLDMTGDGGVHSVADDSSSQDSIGDCHNKKRINEPEEGECIEIPQDQDDEDEKPLAQLAAIVKSEEAAIEYHVENDDEDDNDNDNDNDIDMYEAANVSAELDTYGNDNDNGNNSSAESSDEEYLPQKTAQTSPTGKRRRGRPRIHPPKPKGLGRRGRPPGSKGKRNPKIVEEEEIGEFPCPVCNEFYDRVSLLDKHARDAHPGLKTYHELTHSSENHANHEDTDSAQDTSLQNNKNTAHEVEKCNIRRIQNPDYCCYCKNAVKDFARHIKRNHYQEVEVKKIFKLEAKSIERKRLIAALRKKGNFLKNSKSLYKPVRKSYGKNCNGDYVPCKFCLGLYSSKSLMKHEKNCPQKESAKADTYLSEPPNILVPQLNTDSDLKTKVFIRMRTDKISLIAQKDFLICSFGEKYFNTHRGKKLINVCIRRMRELAKMLIESQKLKPAILNFYDLLLPENFHAVIHSAKVIAKYDPQKDVYGSPTFLNTINNMLKECCNIAIMHLVKQEYTYLNLSSKEAEVKISAFRDLLKSTWQQKVSTQAENNFNIKTGNKGTILATAVKNDVIDLKVVSDDNICETEIKQEEQIKQEEIWIPYDSPEMVDYNMLRNEENSLNTDVNKEEV